MTATVIEPRIDHVLAKDGTSLLTRHWAPAEGTPWASMVLVHGLAEHCGRYDHVGSQLANAGIDVHGFDLRGFGGSGGPRASVERWSQLHDDLEERMVAVRSIDPARPLVLYGHSMGGLLALGYTLDGRAQPDLLVLSAPAIKADLPLIPRLAVRGLKRLAPGLMLKNPFDGDVLSCDPKVAEDYVADPLNQHKSSVRFAAAALAEQDRVSAAVHRLAVPTLVIHGGDDRLVPTASSGVFEGMPGVTRRVYPVLRHETHNEPTGAMVVKDTAGWIRDQAGLR